MYPRGTEGHSSGTQRGSRDTEGFRKRHPRHRRGLPWGTRGTLGGTLGMYSVEYYAEPPVLQRHLTGVLNGYSEEHLRGTRGTCRVFGCIIII